MSYSLKVALDWTPNGNHVGMFVAKAKNWYADAGLQVSFLSPHTDEYKATPASRVESGEASFAVAPSESAISYHIRSASMPKPALKAVGALLQSDDSAIATLKSSGIDRPAKLEGKRYASYAARFEGRIVQEMIRADGGGGDYTELALPMLGVWNTLLSGEADATWIFQGWEGVQASMAGVELNTFKLEDYGIAYGYSPVLLAAPQTLSERGDAVKAFLGATTRGYQWAAANPAEAAQVLVDAAKSEFPDLDRLNLELVKRSVEVVAKACLNGSGEWGRMDAARWDSFLDWLSSKGLLTTKVQSRGPAGDCTSSLDGLRSGDAGEVIPREAVSSSSLFTNDFLP